MDYTLNPMANDDSYSLHGKNEQIAEQADVIAKLIAENSRLQTALAPQEDGWQPIETAPKDETFVLLFCAGAWCPTIGRWNGGRVNHLDGEPLPEGWGDDSTCQD